MIEGRQQRAAVLKSAQPVETDGVEPLEDVAVLAVLGSVAVLLHEALDFLEPRDDPLLARGAPDLLRRLGEVGQFVAQLVEVEVTHSGLRP